MQGVPLHKRHTRCTYSYPGPGASASADELSGERSHQVSEKRLDFRALFRLD